MAKRRYSDEDILQLLREIELSPASGSNVEQRAASLPPNVWVRTATWCLIMALRSIGDESLWCVVLSFSDARKLHLSPPRHYTDFTRGHSHCIV